MNRMYIALAALCLVTWHLTAQSADVGAVQGRYRTAYESTPVVARTMFNGRNVGVRQNLDGSVCFPPPYYDSCIYDLSSYSLDLYRLWTLYTFWNGMAESDPPQPTYTKQSPEPPPPPPPPVTPVMHEYNWPKDANTSAGFSIVTTNGLAGVIHHNQPTRNSHWNRLRHHLLRSHRSYMSIVGRKMRTRRRRFRSSPPAALCISPPWFGCKMATFISIRWMETCARYRSLPFRGHSLRLPMRRRTCTFICRRRRQLRRTPRLYQRSDLEAACEPSGATAK